MKCKDCDSWDKTMRECKLSPSEMEDNACFLRYICWMLADLVENGENDKKDWWKE